MKHYFVENPVSGKNNPVDIVNELIIPAAEKNGIDYEIYQTKERGDGERFVREKCKEANGAPVRFYSVGGDGTLYEVVNGAFGFDNAEITCVPKGSGNDYIRLYGGREAFLNIENLINGSPVTVDGLTIDDGSGWTEVAINQASMGFDAEACAYQGAMKKFPGAIGHATYALAGLYCMFTKVYNTFSCKVDGKPIPGPFLFAVGCNSKWYGSGIKVAWFADPTDGMLDCVLFRRTIWWPTVFKIGLYDWQIAGTHYKRPYCEYIRGKKMEFQAEKPVEINVDGECRKVTRMTLEVAPGAFRFVVPKGSEFFEKQANHDLDTDIDLGFWHKEPYKTIANTLKPFDWIVNKGIMGYGRKRH